MTIARHSYTQGTNSVNDTASVTVAGATAGRLLLILVEWYDATSISTITCPGEAITARGSVMTGHTGDALAKSAWYTIDALAGSGDKTVTVVLSDSAAFSFAVTAWELSGNDASPYDNSTTATGSTTATTSLTTTAANSAIFAVCTSNSTKPSAGSDYIAEDGPNVLGFDNCEYDLDAGAAGSKTVDFGGSLGSWGIHAIAIKAAIEAGAAMMGQACL